MSSTNPPSAAHPSSTDTSTVNWREFTASQLEAIEQARAAVKQANGGHPIEMDPKGTYGLICRACTKPNSIKVDFCTGCSFPASPFDIQRLPDNIFYLLVQGQDIGANVRERLDDIITFDDKYPVSDNHLDVIPTQVYLDISVLDQSHIPLLEKMAERGLEEFKKRNIPWIPKEVSLADIATVGYNFPVSVKHLHVHVVLPPFRHDKVFQYPRWHNHRKVIKDLKEHGKVQLYSDHPNDKEGEEEYQRAMTNQEKCRQWIKEYSEKSQQSNL